MESNRKEQSIQAVAHGLLDGGLRKAFNYPGFFSHDIFEAVGGGMTSLNERIAYAEAYGASYGGWRSLVTFKNVGLNVASDAYMHSVISGVNAGLVLVVTDDISVWGSQESQDSRYYYNFFKGLWLEPSSTQQAYDYSREAFVLSEKYNIPVVIRLTNPYFQLEGTYMRKAKKPSYTKNRRLNPSEFVIHPYYFSQQNENLQNKNNNIKEYVESIYDIPVKTSKRGTVIVGAATQNLKQKVLTDVCHVTTYPIPTDAIKQFALDHDSIEVVEHGGNFVAEAIKATLSNDKVVSHTPKNLGTETKFIKWKRYDRFFAALDNVQNKVVIGDITQFTVEEHDTVDASLALGVAVSTAIGVAETQRKDDRYVFSISGDSSFMHEGVGVLAEAQERKVNIGVIILDNGGSWCTGGQKPPGGLDTLYKIYPTTIKTMSYMDTSTDELVKIFENMKETKGLSILHIIIPFGSQDRTQDE